MARLQISQENLQRMRTEKEIAEDLRGALRELKDFIAGKKQLNTIDSLIDDL